MPEYDRPEKGHVASKYGTVIDCLLKYPKVELPEEE